MKMPKLFGISYELQNRIIYTVRLGALLLGVGVGTRSAGDAGWEWEVALKTWGMLISRIYEAPERN